MAWSEIVANIRSGDNREAEGLYTAVSDCARAQLFRSVDPQVVDDYVQEVLIVVLEAIRHGELRDPECLMGFVRTVTRRQAGVHIRGAIVRRRRLISAHPAFTPVAPSRESPEAKVGFQQRAALLRKVLELLCLRDREILVRFYYDEQNSQQICTEMHLTSTQFRLYKSRALAKCGELTARTARSQSTRPVRIA
jgi:RNA polymerase sigma factor (sigma-70 family)